MSSISDLASLSWDKVNRMSRRELASVVSKMASAGNKRLRRLEATEGGTNAPAYRYIKEPGRGKGDFSVKGKSVGELRAEYSRVRGFLSAHTSSVKGWRETQERARKELVKRTGVDVSEQFLKKYWKAYGKFKELNAGFTSIGSPKVQAELARIMTDHPGMDDDELAVELERVIDEKDAMLETELDEYYETVREGGRGADIDDWVNVPDDELLY